MSLRHQRAHQQVMHSESWHVEKALELHASHTETPHGRQGGHEVTQPFPVRPAGCQALPRAASGRPWRGPSPAAV